MVDDLPSASVIRKKTDSRHPDGQPQLKHNRGIPIAQLHINPANIYGMLTLMNHLIITVDTHTTESNGAIRIVGFEVEAQSVNWGEDPCGRKPIESHGVQYYNQGSRVSYTYQIIFKKSDLLWANRFDHYLKLGDSETHLK